MQKKTFGYMHVLHHSVSLKSCHVIQIKSFKSIIHHNSLPSWGHSGTQLRFLEGTCLNSHGSRNICRQWLQLGMKQILNTFKKSVPLPPINSSLSSILQDYTYIFNLQNGVLSLSVPQTSRSTAITEGHQTKSLSKVSNFTNYNLF